MGKGAGANKEAMRLQAQQSAQSAADNKRMMDIMESQIQTAKQMKLQKSAGPMPLPQTTTADLLAQSQEERKNMLGRNGIEDTKVAPILKSAFGSPIYDMQAPQKRLAAA